MGNAIKTRLEEIQQHKDIQQIEIGFDDLIEAEYGEMTRYQNAVPVKMNLDKFLAVVESLPVPRLHLSYQTIGKSLEQFFPYQQNGSHIKRIMESIHQSFGGAHEYDQKLAELIKAAPYEVITELHLFAEIDGIFMTLPLIDSEAQRINHYLRDV